MRAEVGGGGEGVGWASEGQLGVWKLIGSRRTMERGGEK